MDVSREIAVPPADRTVGQVVAEAIQLYGRRFWRCLALGSPRPPTPGAAFLDGGVQLGYGIVVGRFELGVYGA